jgi:hypothetical protein
MPAKKKGKRAAALRRKTAGKKMLDGNVDPNVGKPYQFKPGQSGNPGGRPKKFSSILSDALKEELGSIDPESTGTYAALIARGMVRGAAKIARKDRLTKDLILFLDKAADRTEGKPNQKVEVGGNLTVEPAERLRELLARALERAAAASR